MTIMGRTSRLRHRRFGRRTATAALLLGVAACTTSAPQRRPAPPPPPPPVVVPPPPVTPPRVEQNRVALLVPLTGTNAAVGQSIANAANLALLDLGDSRINLRVYDTAPGAAAAASKAAGDGARLFLGPLLAGDVRAAAGVASAARIPVVTFSNDASLARGGVFVMGFQAQQSIARAVGYARAHGVERFAALVPAGVYGQRASTAFLRAVEADGGKVVAVATYTRAPGKLLAAARTVTNYDARKAAAAKGATLRPDGTVATVNAKLPPVPFQALLVADTGAVAASVVPALAQFGVAPGSVQLIGTELWINEAGVRNARSLNGAIFAAVPDVRFAQLTTRYRAKFGTAPSRLASLGYDAVLLVNAVAAKWPLGQPFPAGLLTAPEGYAGIDGAFRFASSGIAERALEVDQVGAGTVSPAPKSFAR